MTPLGPLRDHYWLALRMAKTTGTDLAAAHKAGDLSQAEWAQMIHTCRGCTWAKGCPRWMGQHDTDHPDPPQECANHRRLLALKEAL